ncbi:MAG TPA: hypothetical protein VF401_01035 [Candidatus Saccharimonadales bacterium]
MESTDKNYFQAVATSAGRKALDTKGVDRSGLSAEEVREAGRNSIRIKTAKAVGVLLVGAVSALGVMKLSEQQPAEAHSTTTPAAHTETVSQSEATVISQHLGDGELPKAGVTINPGDLQALNSGK